MSAPAPQDCAVVELRRYRLKPGRRDELVALFEAELVDTQEAVGMAVLGTFTDADEPDQFVWLRGFADMATRDAGLRAFYGGPAWAAHGPAANDAMLDSDDVFLLRPTTTPELDGPAGAVLATVVPAGGPDVEHGGRLLARLETEPAENTFPRLPVRPEAVQVTLTAFRDPQALDRALALLPPAVDGEHRARLVPTGTSRITGAR